MAVRILRIFSMNSAPNTTIKSRESVRRAYYCSSKKNGLHKVTPSASFKIPTFEQIERDPALKEKIIQQYKDLANCPDFQQVTKEVMKLGLEGLKKDRK